MRLEPPSYNEKGISLHEAAHCVFSLLFHTAFFPSGTETTPHEDGSWTGAVHFHDTVPLMPDRATTPPHVWRDAVANAWADLPGRYAGAAAARVYTGDSLDAKAIRNDPGCTFGDESAAREIAEHFWPEQHREAILDAAAELAGQLVQVPAVWNAISAVADQITRAYGRQITTPLIEATVRQYVPQAITAPRQAWAVGLALGQS